MFLLIRKLKDKRRYEPVNEILKGDVWEEGKVVFIVGAFIWKMFSRGSDNEESLLFFFSLGFTDSSEKRISSESARLAQNIRKKGSSTQVTVLYQTSWENVCSVLSWNCRYGMCQEDVGLYRGLQPYIRMQ